MNRGAELLTPSRKLIGLQRFDLAKCIIQPDPQPAIFL